MGERVIPGSDSKEPLDRIGYFDFSMAALRQAIQQYGAIVEALVHAGLSFAPVAVGIGDIETERTVQLAQSVSDAVALRNDTFLHPGANQFDVCKHHMMYLMS
jgi:hypothetical protein